MHKTDRTGTDLPAFAIGPKTLAPSGLPASLLDCLQAPLPSELVSLKLLSTMPQSWGLGHDSALVSRQGPGGFYEGVAYSVIVRI